MNKFWTIEEEAFVTLNYPSKGGGFCAQYLNRSIESIRKKAVRLGVFVKSPINPKKFTDEQYKSILFDKELDFINLEPYINTNTPILHQCINEHVWKVAPRSILSHQGCPICAGNIKYTTTEYEDTCGYKVLESYINSHTPILHECKHKHQWKASPNNILRGRGCPTCSKSGFDPNKPAILYYVCFNNLYYKIGITNKSVLKRFEEDKSSKVIRIIIEKHFNKGYEARQAEQAILQQFKEFRITVPNYLKSKGNTELFSCDLIPKGLLF